jgi:hypothetical protein
MDSSCHTPLPKKRRIKALPSPAPRPNHELCHTRLTAGHTTTAVGSASTSMGDSTTATGHTSTATGFYVEAKADESLARCAVAVFVGVVVVPVACISSNTSALVRGYPPKFTLEDAISSHPARLKLLHVCDRWYFARVLLLLPVDTAHSVQTL